jgi:hypothetical protein
MLLPCLLLVVAARAAAAAEVPAGPAFPLKPSDNGRYLVDAKSIPFFYHADTAWNLPKKLTAAEAEEYFDACVRRGFTAVQIQAVSKEQGPTTNRGGHNPFDPLDDILKPVEAYWQHLDQVLHAAQKRQLFVAIAPLWIRWGGTDKEGWRNQLTDANARPYARFLGNRYKWFDNLMWVVGGDANPKEKANAIREMAAGLKETAPHHLVTVHNAPENSSAEHFGADNWLDVNMAYTYREVQGHVLDEYLGRKPPRPIVLGESGYERENNDKRGGDPFRMRRQAYKAILSGALGGHAFGQKHVWRLDADWRKGLDSPASRQMAHVKALFATRPWHRLVPDARNETLVDGRGDNDDDRAVAARTDDGKLILVYVPTSRRITVDLSRLSGPVTARWFHAARGEYAAADGAAQPLPNRGRAHFLPPRFGTSDGDFVLVLEAK